MKSKPTPFGVPKRLDPPPRLEGVFAPEGYRLVRNGTVASGDMIHLRDGWTMVLPVQLGTPVDLHVRPIARRIETRVSTDRFARVSTAAEASREQIANDERRRIADEMYRQFVADVTAANRRQADDEIDAQATRAYVDDFTALPTVTFHNTTFEGRRPASKPSVKKPKNAPLTEAQRAIAFPGPRKMIKLT